jgi:homoserine kinase
MRGVAAPVGRSVSVEVPATSANLGPGFDCFGLALDWRDRIEVEVIEAGFVAEVTGEGAATLPRDESHLVIATILEGVRKLGGNSLPGLRLRAHNTIPHGRGLGSSSAAIVSGLRAAAGLAGVDPDPAWLLARATAIEGHPDNVAAAIYGGFVLAYATEQGTVAVQADVHPEVQAAVFIPQTPVSTKTARGLLPATVPHADAAANAGRAALLVHALGRDPRLLFDATHDWLHQEYRRFAMTDSYALLKELRAAGLAAVISGAGPTVLVLGTGEQLRKLARHEVPNFSRRVLSVSKGVRAV